jgi:plasmid stability protein
MSRSITIRDVPDEVVDELAARAKRSGRSMQEYLKGQLSELSSRPDREEFWARVQERKLATGDAGISTEFILDAIRSGRR